MLFYYVSNMFGSIIVPIIIFVVILVQVSNLKKRVRDLEDKMSGASVGPQAIPTAPSVSPIETVTLGQNVPSPEPEVLVAREPDLGERFAVWLKEDWMMKIGAGLILLAFGWFLTYAFMNNWIGPMGRIFIGFAAGIGFLLFGFKRLGVSTVQGGVFTVLGSTVSILTAFSAYYFYHMFGVVPLLIIALMSSAFVTVAGLSFRRMELAVASLLLACFAPVLVQANISHGAMFAYLFVVSIGSLWVVALSKWRVLTFLSLVIVSIYSVSVLTTSNPKDMIGWACAFSGLFFAANIAAMIRGTVETIVSDIKTAFLNALFIVVWIMAGVGSVYQSLAVSACALAFLLASFLVFKVTKKALPFFVYAGIAFVMIGIATALELSGPVLTLGFILESIIFVALSYFLTRDRLLTERVSLAIMIPGFMAFTSVRSYSWHSSVFHSDCLVLVLISLALFALGYFLISKSKVETGVPSSVGRAWVAWGSLYTLILIWLVVHAVSSTEMTGNFVTLVIYTIIAIITYFTGVTHGDTSKKVSGGILLGFVCVHLLFVESVSMGSAERIVTFFVIGALLLGTAFITKRLSISHPQA
jgi:uncharacterized membrane protein